jgi:hypothetical protein
VTGSLKGAEERDFLFSKLFCILSIIRSGKTAADRTEHMNLLDRLIELHEQKGWMREVVVEALLTFCSTLTDAGTINATLVKLRPLLEVSVKDMAAWQVCLAVGLHQLHTVSKAKVGAVWQSEWRKEMANVEVGKEPLTMQSIGVLKDTLLASTTGYPKVCTLDTLVCWSFTSSCSSSNTSCKASAFVAVPLVFC